LVNAVTLLVVQHRPVQPPTAVLSAAVVHPQVDVEDGVDGIQVRGGQIADQQPL
jgi:hypothetical protein